MGIKRAKKLSIVSVVDFGNFKAQSNELILSCFLVLSKTLYSRLGTDIFLQVAGEHISPVNGIFPFCSFTMNSIEVEVALIYRNSLMSFDYDIYFYLFCSMSEQIESIPKFGYLMRI